MEKVLFYLRLNTDGYARGISLKLSLSLSVVQKQLKRLEDGGVVVSRLVGRTRLYSFSPNWAFKKQLDALLDAVINGGDRSSIYKKYTERKRPRRSGKPLPDNI